MVAIQHVLSAVMQQTKHGRLTADLDVLQYKLHKDSHIFLKNATRLAEVFQIVSPDPKNISNDDDFNRSGVGDQRGGRGSCGRGNADRTKTDDPQKDELMLRI